MKIEQRSNNKATKIKAVLVLFLCSLVVNATPVRFNSVSLTGTVNNRQILVTPDVSQNPLVIGTNLVSTAPFLLQPVGGEVITNLLPWGYTIKVDGWPRSAHIIVPDDTATNNAASLINTNLFAPISIYTGDVTVSGTGLDTNTPLVMDGGTTLGTDGTVTASLLGTSTGIALDGANMFRIADIDIYAKSGYFELTNFNIGVRAQSFSGAGSNLTGLKAGNLTTNGLADATGGKLLTVRNDGTIGVSNAPATGASYADLTAGTNAVKTLLQNSVANVWTNGSPGNGAGLTNVNGGILLSNTLWVNVNAPGPGIRGNQSSPYPNFTNAVNAALPGDTIILYPGQTNWVFTSLGMSNISIIGTGSTVISTNGTGTNFWLLTGDLNITGGTYIFTNNAATAAAYASSTIVPMTMVSGIGRQSTYNFENAKFISIADIIILNRPNISFSATACGFASQFDNFLVNNYTNIVGTIKACDLIVNTQPSFATNSVGQGYIANGLNIQGGNWTITGSRIVVSNAIAANRGIRVGATGVVKISGTSINVGNTNLYSRNNRIFVDPSTTGGVWVDGHPYTDADTGIYYVGDTTNNAVSGMAISASSDGSRKWSGDLGAVTNLNGAYGSPSVTATTFTNTVIVSNVPDNAANGYYYWAGNNAYTNAAGYGLWDDEVTELAWTITNSCGTVTRNGGGGDLSSLTNSTYETQPCGLVPGISTVGVATFAVSNVLASPTTWTFTGTIIATNAIIYRSQNGAGITNAFPSYTGTLTNWVLFNQNGTPKWGCTNVASGGFIIRNAMP